MKVTGSTSPGQLLGELIAIPSVNPAFLPKCDKRAGEQAVAEYLAGQAAMLGLPVQLEEVYPLRPNFLTRLIPSGRTRQTVVLAPHLDTVGLPGNWAALLEPVVKSGRIYGRGACDTKGSIAAMFTALSRVATSGRRPSNTEILFVGLVDEENAQVGARAFAKRKIKANLAIVGEPTRQQVVTAHKGDVWLRLETHGKAAHGSRPELGKNAVHEMAQIVHLLERTYASQLKRRRHPILGRATVNVGSIGGGTQPNIVPAHCFITVDRRTLPGETESSVRREIKALLAKHRLKATLASARNHACLPLETDWKRPLVRDLFRTVGQSRVVGVDYFCDAAVLSAGGIPSVVFGPGDIAQAHTADEWISIRDLQEATDCLERFFRSLP